MKELSGKEIGELKYDKENEDFELVPLQSKQDSEDELWDKAYKELSSRFGMTLGEAEKIKWLSENYTITKKP